MYEFILDFGCQYLAVLLAVFCLNMPPHLLGSTMAISVQCPQKRYVVILFQPVTLTCNFQTSSTQPPVVTWRYKSYCRDPIQAALNPSSADNMLSKNNPKYNPNIECSDSLRTVRNVASKQGGSVTLSQEYQGRKITITNSEFVCEWFYLGFCVSVFDSLYLIWVCASWIIAFAWACYIRVPPFSLLILVPCCLGRCWPKHRPDGMGRQWCVCLLCGIGSGPDWDQWGLHWAHSVGWVSPYRLDHLQNSPTPLSSICLPSRQLLFCFSISSHISSVPCDKYEYWPKMSLKLFYSLQCIILKLKLLPVCEILYRIVLWRNHNITGSY